MPNDPSQQAAIFRTYAVILTAMLIASGLLLTVLTFGLRKNLRSAWVTYASWCVLIPAALVAIYWGRVPTVLFFLFFALVGFWEFARATGLAPDVLTTAVGLLLILCTGVCAFRTTGLYMVLPIAAVCLFVLIPILRDRAEGQLRLVALAVLGFVYVGWMFLHVALLAALPGGVGYLLYLLTAVELSDVAAYTFGRLLGKRSLRPGISPRKTWEGALGALAVSMVLPWLLRFSLPQFGTLRLLLAGIIVGAGGQLGDLSMSVFKRDLGVKDMGSIIPGHGGVLDRIDSLMYAGPLFFHMIWLFHAVGSS